MQKSLVLEYIGLLIQIILSLTGYTIISLSLKKLINSKSEILL